MHLKTHENCRCRQPPKVRCFSKTYRPSALNTWLLISTNKFSWQNESYVFKLYDWLKRSDETTWCNWNWFWPIRLLKAQIKKILLRITRSDRFKFYFLNTGLFDGSNYVSLNLKNRPITFSAFSFILYFKTFFN